jgi:hypothetical protein
MEPGSIDELGPEPGTPALLGPSETPSEPVPAGGEHFDEPLQYFDPPPEIVVEPEELATEVGEGAEPPSATSDALPEGSVVVVVEPLGQTVRTSALGRWARRYRVIDTLRGESPGPEIVVSQYFEGADELPADGFFHPVIGRRYVLGLVPDDLASNDRDAGWRLVPDARGDGGAWLHETSPGRFARVDRAAVRIERFVTIADREGGVR